MKTEPKKILGILAFLFFFLTTIVSIYTYEGYKFFSQNFSDLGVGVNAIFFNYGIMITAILLAMYFYFAFYEKRKIFVLALLSAIGLFLVGFFPLNFSFLHYVSAALFFVASLFLIFIHLLKAKKMKMMIISIIPVIIIITYIFTEIPILQKLSVFSIIAWHLYSAFS